MNTIALRFGETFAPEGGTIKAHQVILDSLGYVWYGKLGNPVSDKVLDEIKDSNGMFWMLLINSGKAERNWVQVEEVSKKTPEAFAIPDYYRDSTERFKTWFKITKIIPAPKDIMSKCRVVSSDNTLSDVSKHSMSPYFIIECNEEVNE